MNETDLARGVLARLSTIPLSIDKQQALEAQLILQAMHDYLLPYVKHWRKDQISTYKKAIARNEWDANFYREQLAKLEYICEWCDRLANVTHDNAVTMWIQLNADNSPYSDGLNLPFVAALNILWKTGKIPAATAGAIECDERNSPAAIEARENWKALHGNTEPQPLALDSLELA